MTDAIPLNAELGALGQGVVHVQIKLLNNGLIMADTTATLLTAQSDVSVTQT